MRRPSHQAKLVLFGLLKTATALASTCTKGGAVAPLTTNPICLRLATPEDVPSIAAVNLQTLPENYNHQFYLQHISQYPQLAFVAVEQEKTDNVVGYCLGKILDSNCRVGHVSSLAILPEYRRLGLASQLLLQFHHCMEQNCVQFAGLHVRQTNRGAQKLYQHLGYETTEIIPQYYEDGEDAYYMRKVFLVNSAPNVLAHFLPSVRKHVKNTMKQQHLQLPRYLYPNLQPEPLSMSGTM